MLPPRGLEPFCIMAQGYKKKIPFTLSWIPYNENMAQDSVDI